MAADSGPDHNRAPRRRILFAGVVIFVIVGGIGAPLILVFTHGERELSEAVAEADRLDPGWRWQDLQARRPQIPDAENSARPLQLVGNLLPKNWPTWSNVHFADEKEYRAKVDFERATRNVVASFDEMISNQQFSTQQIAAMEGELKSAAAALKEARQLCDYPRGRFPHSKDAYNTSSVDYVSKLRTTCQLLHFDAAMNAQEGDVHAAITSCRASLNALASLRDEPVLISQLVRFAGRAMLSSTIERVLAQVEANDEDLRRLQAAIEEEERSHADLLCVRACRVEMDDYFTLRAAGKVQTKYDQLGHIPWHYKLPGWLQRCRAEYLKWHNAQVEMAKQPLHLQDWKKAPYDETVLTTASALIKVVEANQRTCAQLRSLAAGLAAERFRQAKGRWPKVLAELTPEYLAAVPADPYDGNPLRLVTRPDGLVIYSLGPDKIDQGGKLRREHDEQRIGLDGLDFGIQLWGVPARRQPPPPELTLKEFFHPVPPEAELP